MDTEDFSFPRISDTHAHSIDSPPLWNLSPAASPNPYYQGNKLGEGSDSFGAKLVAQTQRKSFSCVENGIRKRIGFGFDDDDEDDEVEERMDLLWEDFNEELLLSSSATTASANSSSSSSSREVVEFRCDLASTVSKAKHGSMVPNNRNRPSMVVIVKVLKKLFSVSNSQRKPITRVRC